MIKRAHNDTRNREHHGEPSTTITYFQLPEHREQPCNEELIMAKASVTGTSYLRALTVECQQFAQRTEIAKSCMLRMFSDFNFIPRYLTGFVPADPEEETRAFDTIFYGPPNALVARGLLLARINIVIVWEGGRKVRYYILIYESIGLLRAPILINVCHGMYGFRMRDCNISDH